MGFIGRYETYEQIGAGSMGSVYRARDIVLDRPLALKVLHLGQNLNPEMKERFFREARACAGLQHPGIVTVYEIGEAAGAAYIAMELMTGADLRRYIQEAKPISLAKKLDFLAQVCDGLAHAHRHGIVHGDIKPSNIFVHEEKQSKVLDFGIARLPSADLTLVGKLLGTPNYMAPEQILGRPCDARSDLFSAGIVFFEFLVNSHPFQSSFIPRRIAEDEPDSLSERDSPIPESLERLLAKALRKDPGERIRSAEEFAAGFREVSKDLLVGLVTPVNFDIAAQSNERLAGATDEIVLTSEVCAEQQRIPEFIRLLGKFDEALRLGQIDLANQTMEQMRQVAALDRRFTEAVNQSQEELERSLPDSEFVPPRAAAAAAGASLAGGRESYAGRGPSAPNNTREIFGRREPLDFANAGRQVRPCRRCDTWNQGSAKFCVQCGENLVPRSFLGERAEQTKLGTRSTMSSFHDAALAILRRFVSAGWMPRLRPGTVRVTNVFAALNRNAQLVWSRLSGLAPAQKLIGAVGTAAFLLIISAIIAGKFSRSVSIEKAIGAAVVRASVTDLLQKPAGNSKRLGNIRQGTRVNILEQMKAREPFAYVQVVMPGKNSPPGYVKTADLGRWESDDSATAWSFLRLFGPSQGASEDQQLQFIDEMQRFAMRFRGSPQVSEAGIEQARALIALAGQHKSAGNPQWKRDVEKAWAALASVSSAGLADDVAHLRNELDAIVPPSPPVSRPGQEADALSSRISVLFDNGDYSGAMALVDRLASIDSAKNQADWWKAKVIKAQRALDELSQ